ncbi:WcbI family polysaccharide biosynthesis putative acetyltransferase [Teichococcus aestuarii]|uniref:WcbI family polysaccharide biosynthesis putative acetyltransferase n=1 Tax=Teichococcus aestuarii TaxID=568898 RepID=UPI0036089ADE
MSHIVIVGNCQAQFLEGIFAIAGTVPVEKLAPNFTLTDADRDHVLEKLDAASFIFFQRTADEFKQEWLRSRWITERYAGKSLIWPNVYFDGYFPGTRYIYNSSGKLQSPLDEYHLAPVLQAWKEGQDEAQALKRLHEDTCGTPDPFAASLQNLRDRERDCSIPMSDFIEREIYKTKCFYTPNHPHTYVLVELAKRLAEAANVPLNVEKALTWPYHLDRIDLPVFHWIEQKYKLSFSGRGLYKGVSIDAIEGARVTVGAPCIYDPQTLVQKFYSIYRAAL